MSLTRELLLTLILTYYAEIKHWTPGISSKPKVIIDQGRLAKSAINAKSIGELMVIFCNSINISISEVARKCGVSMPRMTDIIMHGIISSEESNLIWKILNEECMKYYGKS
jgi:hypothetical protein